MKTESIVWHFTKPETISKILSPVGGGLLSTHIRFLDDPRDGELSRPIAEEAGDLLYQLLSAEDICEPERARMRDLANEGIKLSMFATCFCKTIDSPFMWRVYAGNGGFAIGFRKDSILKNLVSPLKTIIKSGYCRYPVNIEEERKRFLARKRRKLDHHAVSMAFAMASDSTDSTLVDTFAELYELALEAVFFKHRFYRNEQEFRIVQSVIQFEGLKELVWIGGKPRLPLRTRIPLSEMVEEIVVSPLGNVQQNLSAALLVAESTGIGCQKVRKYVTK